MLDWLHKCLCYVCVCVKANFLLVTFLGQENDLLFYRESLNHRKRHRPTSCPLLQSCHTVGKTVWDFKNLRRLKKIHMKIQSNIDLDKLPTPLKSEENALSLLDYRTWTAHWDREGKCQWKQRSWWQQKECIFRDNYKGLSNTMEKGSHNMIGTFTEVILLIILLLSP